MDSQIQVEPRRRHSENQQKDPEGIITAINETQIKRYTTITTIEITDDSFNSKDSDELVILTTDPTSRRSVINKPAYAKLHRTPSPSKKNNIGSLKEKYETNNKPDVIDVKDEVDTGSKTEPTSEEKLLERSYTSIRTSPVKLDEETVQSLKNKYSPASFGYPRPASRNSKLPVPKPRSAVKSQLILPSNRQYDRSRLRYSLDVGKKSNSKDENSNEVYRKNSSSSGEFITIVTRSESEGSVDKFGKELDLFTMDEKAKEKKKNNSFKKIFSGRIFGKDKKKKDEEKVKLRYKEKTPHSDNVQNETNAFSRQAPYRHTTGGSSNVKSNEARETRVTRSESDKLSEPKKVYITKEMEDKYAQMHISQFNHIKQGFEQPNSTVQPVQGYVRMDKPVAKSNPGPTNYMNLPNVKKYIDTSSSASTLESERSNIYQNASKERNELDHSSSAVTPVKFNEGKDFSRDTPPRAQELRQDVRLVNPKALIPINSERPLPNPYQNNSSTLDKPKFPNTNSVERTKRQPQPHFVDTYGIVDNTEYVQGRGEATQRPASSTNGTRGQQKPPQSPSLESTKLKLPTNREIVPLSPRIKSPIPHDHVSTEKLIATELLKPTKSPPPTRKSNSKLSTSSHQKLEIDIDYPDNINNERHERSIDTTTSVSSKPPLSKMPYRSSTLTRQPPPTLDKRRLSQSSPGPENLENFYAKYRISQASPLGDNQEKLTTNAMVHVNSPKTRTPTPNNLQQNRPSSPMRPPSVRSSTPVDLRSSPSTKSSPQKDDMRKSVEAYYWKEIKKLKEQENFDLYLYQMQMTPYGYAEDPINVRRSRSLSPTTHRNSRRSLSLPRDPRAASQSKEFVENPYGRLQQEAIPEGRAVINEQRGQRNIPYGQMPQQYQNSFRRNAPERRTIDSTPSNYDRYNNSLYKPIFKRGSLTTPVRELPEDLQNKKVSFSGSRIDPQTLQSWPTKNGFTQSPPQRRIENNRNSSLEDDVFLPTTPKSAAYDRNEVYGYTTKPNLYNYSPNPNEGIYQRSRQNQEPLYGPNPTLRYRPIQPEEYRHPQEEYPYGRPIDAVPGTLTRHGSIQIQEPVYEQRQIITRRMSYDNAPVNVVVQRRVQEPQYVNKQQIVPHTQVDPRYGFKREIIVTDEIFGQFGGYVPENGDNKTYLQRRQLQNPVYSSRQSIAEPVYGRSRPKQVSVRNQVCDIYGQIHDRDSPTLTPPNHIRRSGVLLGELQSNPGSPRVVRQSYTHLPNEQFVRNTRLTASANDMYQRYQGADQRYRSNGAPPPPRYPQQDPGAPTRPLPPVPTEQQVLLRNNSARSDTESASDASEMLRVKSSGAKNKKRSFFGK